MTLYGSQCRCHGLLMPASRLAVGTPRFDWFQVLCHCQRRASPVPGLPLRWSIPFIVRRRMMISDPSSLARGLLRTAARGLATWLVFARACSCTAPTTRPVRAAVVGIGTVVPWLHLLPPWPAPWVLWRPSVLALSSIPGSCHHCRLHCGGRHRGGAALFCFVPHSGWEQLARWTVVDGT